MAADYPTYIFAFLVLMGGTIGYLKRGKKIDEYLLETGLNVPNVNQGEKIFRWTKTRSIQF